MTPSNTNALLLLATKAPSPLPHRLPAPDSNGMPVRQPAPGETHGGIRNSLNPFTMIRKLLFACLLTAVCSLLPASAQVKVAIFSINDFHGALVRNDAKGIPGAPAVWQTLDSLKRCYPNHVTVAAGDNFGGSYFYNATRGVLMPMFFDALGIRISALGNHEFDDGQRQLAAKWSSSPLRPKNWDMTYVCANVRQTATGRIPDFAQPVASVPLTLTDGKTIRIAFVGLIASSTPIQASARKLSGLSFDGNYPAVLDSVMQLPEASLVNDAAIKLLLTHNGTRVNRQGQIVWDDKDSANLARIDHTLWDGILTSHSHQLVAGRINDAQYPVVQGSWHGNYISMLLCTLDTTRMIVTDVDAQTIRVTPKAQLEAGPARLQAQIDSLLQHTCTAGGTPIGEVLAQSKQELTHDRNYKHRQTEVGTLVSKAYAEAFRKAAGMNDTVAIIGCTHLGSIRAGLPKGPITVLDVGEALPFNNRLKVYRLTGKELMQIVDLGLHNERFGWLQTGNIKIIQNGNTQVTALIYTSPKGKSHVLQPKNKYYLVADEFMTTGGDGYDPKLFPAEAEVEAPGMPATTDAFINYLRQLGNI